LLNREGDSAMSEHPKWEYQELRMESTEDARVELNSFGKEGWEAIGITMWFNERLVIMKRRVLPPGTEE
jgi:hypothetical protein